MKRAILSIVLLGATGCVSANRNAAELHSASEREMTLGIVQREIRNGMTQDEVAEALGSPNIVTKDRGGRETWVYDKIATEASYSKSSGSVLGGVGAGGEPGAALILGLIGGGYQKDAGASATSQKTLTVVIKFDTSGQVVSSRYHSSRF